MGRGLLTAPEDEGRISGRGRPGRRVRAGGKGRDEDGGEGGRGSHRVRSSIAARLRGPPGRGAIGGRVTSGETRAISLTV